MALSIDKLYDNLAREGIIFCFCGSVSQSIVEGIGETLWQRMELEGTETSTIKTVFPIFVEQIQNILTHSAEKITPERVGGEELRFGIVTVGRSSGHFYVSCGNYVERQSAEILGRRLTQLRDLDQEELKEFYKKQRRLPPKEDESNGAGLGFIEMARRASKPLEFEITPMEDGRLFFSMIATI